MGYVADDHTLTAEGRSELRAQYADAVVGHLRSAIDRGCRTLAKFEAPHFAAVREHPGFIALLAELRSGTQSAR
jgi:hypothetical protein